MQGISTLRVKRVISWMEEVIYDRYPVVVGLNAGIRGVFLPGLIRALAAYTTQSRDIVESDTNSRRGSPTDKRFATGI